MRTRDRPPGPPTRCIPSRQFPRALPPAGQRVLAWPARRVPVIARRIACIVAKIDPVLADLARGALRRTVHGDHDVAAATVDSVPTLIAACAAVGAGQGGHRIEPRLRDTAV